ncbi:LCP family protein [Streptomyces sp. 4N509B]|uniref:LCP family protein n=1 Tax=Streptomyces sp. 4N509B TaxID=3457413 RepID=UPI003FCFEB3C
MRRAHGSVEAQGPGGGGGEIDPADQWVYNPNTGEYELRVSGSQGWQGGRRPGHAAPDARGPRTTTTGRNTPPRQRRDARPAEDPSSASSASSSSASPAGPAAPGRRAHRDRPLPGQRDRRAPHSRRKPKPRRSRKRKALMWTSGVLTMLLLTGCAVVGYMWWRLNANIDSTDVVGEDTGYEDGEPVNILFIGTDDRTGEGNTGYGNEGDSGRADTTVLMHFSAEREHATGLSIPRDLITDIPECEVRNSDGSTTVIPGSEDVRFNESLGVSGRDAGCTWRTVEHITGVEINHYIMADFNAVKDMSTAVGGVEVCVAEPIDDPKSHLQLDAGRHELQGEDALAFVRTRYSVGTGSDLSRIELQQQFLASLAREVTSVSLTRMWDLADAATKALTVDNAIGSVQELYDLSQDLGRVPMRDMAFLTVPVVDNTDGATVLVDESRAQPIFEMLQQDISMTDDGRPSGGGGGGGGRQEMAPPEEVRVDVYNGGEVIGAAQETVTWLQNEQGVPLSTNAGNAAQPQERTTLEYGPDQADQAARLRDMMGLPKRAMQEGTANAGDEPMVLILGNDFSAAGEPIGGPPRKPDDVDSITADDEDVCAS